MGEVRREGIGQAGSGDKFRFPLLMKEGGPGRRRVQELKGRKKKRQGQISPITSNKMSTRRVRSPISR